MTSDERASLDEIRNAAQSVVSAYWARFASMAGTNLLGPIDLEIEALQKALEKISSALTLQ